METNTPEPATWPLLRLGFRPFYLGAAALAAVSVPLWFALYQGALTAHGVLPGLLWHAHEMLFGFAAAVIAGFLMTAVRNWTGLATPQGATLGALALLWLAARLAGLWVLMQPAAYGLYALLDLALLPAVATLLLGRLLRAGNRRNLPLVGLLFALTVANAAFHLSQLGAPLPALRSLYAALGLIVMVETLMAGRVVPAFTANATPGLRMALRPWLERATLSTTALGLALWVLTPTLSRAAAVALAAAATCHFARQWQWAPWVTRDRPILWILHAAYAWIGIGFALLAWALWWGQPVSLGVHALAVGATGGLIIGMITRTARGHTGRMLTVGAPEVWAYALVMLAALARVFWPLLAPQQLTVALATATAAWSLAFALYLWVYTPWLMQARVDGKDG
ncbi:MAG TPA: NnrS family protein [Burkholderiaceae bacterium]|nr:NnrS family protein [Burkholderiaceae bacterium]